MSDIVLIKSNLTARTIAAGQASLAGQRRGVRGFMPFVGPAVIASIAYMDPGNYATNIQAGAKYGTTLLWVVVTANIIAMMFQAMSAKLGIVTGQSLASLCRSNFPRPLVLVMWVVSEIAAMATDLAEFLGAAIGLSLLTGIGLMPGLVITGVITYALLTLHNRGFRPLELIIGGFVAVIGLAYVVELFIAPPLWGQVAHDAFTPHIADSGALMLAVGIVGATVMPHAIYLHSSLTANRMPATNDSERRLILRYSNREVLIALSLAGMVNMAMIIMAAVAFHTTNPEIATIETAYATLTPLLGGFAASVFLLSVLASGLSSSVVGTLAGQGIMQDMVHFRIPLWVRRLVTMAPAFVVVWIGADPTDSLVMSQVVLSIALPVPMIALLVLAGRRDVMGIFANRRYVQVAAVIAAVGVLALNAVLLAGAAGIDFF
ncbi:MAG: Nramp family divalent metal transporter [Acetobacteraceae bacterium]|nr:Nramp family divalent metal transporter [Acetobacteraceae bacterium]